MRLILKGQDVGFKFSAAHLLPGHFKCSRMHGHNYVLDVEIETSELVNGMILDFVEIKKVVREFLEQFDHKLLLPSNADNLSIEQSPTKGYKVIVYHLPKSELNASTGIPLGEGIVSDDDNIFANKEYVIPKTDIVQIPKSYVTAEELVEYIHQRLYPIIYSMCSTKPTVTLTLYEDSGQGVTIS